MIHFYCRDYCSKATAVAGLILKVVVVHNIAITKMVCSDDMNGGGVLHEGVFLL